MNKCILFIRTYVLDIKCEITFERVTRLYIYIYMFSENLFILLYDGCSMKKVLQIFMLELFSGKKKF